VKSLTDYDVTTLAAEFSAWGHRPSHAAKLLREYYRATGNVDLESLELGRALIATFNERIAMRRSTILATRVAADGTTKLLVGFPDAGGAVESVMMPSHRPDDAAGCVSSQIGCAMGCDFCASTRHGLTRDLQAGEIVEQFLHLKAAAASVGRRLRTIVFMGMGEPLLNLDNVVAAIRRIADPNMGSLGWRQITVSTVGIVPAIDALAAADLNVHLAVSLHAPDDETRSRLVPMNRRWRVSDVMAAAKRFEAATNRIPTIEYCLLQGVNDSDGQARLLGELMKDFRAHVNLIPYNSIGSGISGMIYEKPGEERVRAFMKILRSANVVAHVRRPRGDDVDAACGQLVSLSRTHSCHDFA
jgi:23S rRNA (adenine2503-C2)-methyltransferase